MPRRGSKASQGKLLVGNGDAADGYNPYTGKGGPDVFDKLALAAKVGNIAVKTAANVGAVGVKSVDAQYDLDGMRLVKNRRAAVNEIVARTGVTKYALKRAAMQSIVLEEFNEPFNEKTLEGFQLPAELLPDVRNVADMYKASVAQARAAEEFHNSTAYWAFGPKKRRTAHPHRHVNDRAIRDYDDDYSDSDVMFGL